MTQHKHFLDWVRVLAFLLLIFFHCAMPFVTFGWEIKNKEQSVALSRLIWWMHQWRLPLLFFVAGVATHFSLQKRSVISFVGERVVRLLVPLLFAMFFTIPLQVYFEYLQKGRISGSYGKFYPQVWDMIPYPQGALTWSHMWFVVYLFVFTMLLVPLFALFKIKWLQAWKVRLANALGSPLAAALLFIPLAICYYSLFIKYPEQQSLLDDWFLFLFSLILVLYGYILGSSEKFWDSCERFRVPYLVIALGSIVILYIRYWWNFNMPKQNNFDLYLYGTLNALHVWLLILAALGFARKYLNFSNPFLSFANQAVYPFYILHQTIIVAAGFYIVQWPLPIFVKMLLLVLVTFTALLVIYRFLIKPFIITRILYGMRPKERKK
ncbi:MAG TPA: acyltransferase family protein [Puia sp.]|nr:acyltransferase family protein [Puia sp.]